MLTISARLDTAWQRYYTASSRGAHFTCVTEKWLVRTEVRVRESEGRVEGVMAMV